MAPKDGPVTDSVRSAWQLMVAREGCPGLPGLPPGARLAAGLTTDPATREGRLKKKKKGILHA